MKKFTQFILPLFFLSFFAHGQQDAAGLNSTATHWTKYVDSKFEILYPKDWDENTVGQMGTTFSLVSPLASENDVFRENVNLIVQDLKGLDVTLSDFVEISENQVETLMENGEILTSESHENQNGECHKLIYNGTYGVYDLRFVQFYWIIDDTSFVLTFSCEEDQYDAYKNSCDKIMNSFYMK